MPAGIDDLVQRCQQGELAAFTLLFNEYENQVYRLALTILRNEQDAQDAVQDTFLRVFERIKRFKGQSSFKTWLTTIVVNLCRDRLRRRKVRQAFSLDWLRGQASGYRLTEEVAQRERQRTLLAIIDQLDDKYRLPVILHYFEGLPCGQVAEVLQIRTSTVYSRLNTARNQIREAAGRQSVLTGSEKTSMI